MWSADPLRNREGRLQIKRGRTLAAPLFSYLVERTRRSYDEEEPLSKKPIGQLEDRLKELRYRNGWSQVRAAIVMGVCDRTLRRAESGERVSERTTYLLERFLKHQEATT